MSKTSDLLNWQVCNPSNLEDQLPQPYCLIDQILKQTIIHQLQLNMHHIQQKKKNQNYQGKVQQYIAQTLIEIDHDLCCLSSTPKYQNYLLAGDRKGNILVIDVAKKSLFCKKQLTPHKRINYITQVTIFDGQSYVTVSAVVSNNSNTIKILRNKHNDPKIFVFAQIQVAPTQDDINKLPYECNLEDEGRLLIVKTYEGSILSFCLPEISLDEQKIKNQLNLNETMSNASNSIKKPTIYPLEHGLLDKPLIKVSQKLFQINFKGYQKSLKYKDLLNKIKNKSKINQPQPTEQTNKKDTKKDTKKVQAPITQAPKQPQKQIIHNQKIIKKQPQTWNNNDVSPIYQKPYFQPFFYLLYEQVEHPRKKSYQKGKNIKMVSKLIYGWYNTKQVYCLDLLKQTTPKFQHIPYYIQFLLNQTILSADQQKQLQTSYSKSFVSSAQIAANKTIHRMVYRITCSALAFPDMMHLALGLEDGTISVYDSKTMTLEYNTQKHSSKVVKLQFFQNGWKTISGSDNGQVHINNILEQKCQVKRTQIFQPSSNTPIRDIKLNPDLGIAFVIDSQGNTRIYDIWRNQKISRFSSSTPFSIAQGKGKRFIPIQSTCSTSTIYTNRDYSISLSIDWPHIPNSKAIQVSPQLIQKVEQLTINPWKSKQVNIHVIRNFQFLLDNFDGLQTIYKKGYQKAKILNLFTNLQFTQLYDRNFDIPDFGRTVNINSNQNGSTLGKSNLSSSSKFNMSKKSSSKQKTFSKQKHNQRGLLSGGSSSKQTPNNSKNVKLTTQVLHPQKFLFQRRKINDPNKILVTTNQKLIQTIREQHKKKQRRANMLQDQLNRTSGGI